MVFGGVLLALFGHGFFQSTSRLEVLVSLDQLQPLLFTLLQEEGLLAALDRLLFLGLHHTAESVCNFVGGKDGME